MTTVEVLPDLAELARQLRIDLVRATARAGAGHPTSGASAADVMAVLSSRFRYDVTDPAHPGNDRFILSKGHASTLLYAWLKAMGAIDDDELLTYGQPGSRLEGHPRPVLPWVDVATGSLGQGVAAGVGLALALARLEASPARVFVLCGDSELAEGSVWEAFEHAAHYRLDNLVVIVDANRLGQRGPTMVDGDTAVYARRAEAFGWRAVEVDGHDLAALDQAFGEALSPDGRPVAILARTEKGHGLGSVAGANGYHGRPLADPDAALTLLGNSPNARIVPPPPGAVTRVTRRIGAPTLPRYEPGSVVPTRLAYGQTLVALGDARDDIVVLDAETNNSTYAELFAVAHPDRYFEMFIAEQQMLAAAVGFAARGFTPFASTFAAFTTRAFEFARMAAIGRTAVRLCGSHAGLSVGESGPSGMGLEDIACFRAVAGSTVLQPCDANQTAALVAAAADIAGFTYLRTTRGGTPVIYAPGEVFPIGGSKVLAAGPADAVTLVGSGVTVHAALAARDILARTGVAARVVDCYSIKPIDAATLTRAASETRLVVTVEDHYREGGLGSAVADVLATAGSATPLRILAVPEVPTSGPAAALTAWAGLDAAGIAAAVVASLAAAEQTVS
ncbi:transketolase [Frankia sp. Cr2]|uniref:transketolase n=1 Tax=Frankia sp. Cr2 TaxID=3073932 RepID=UPI002AD4405A|nr:transketolase [Frankia sp. Cr2]